MEVSKHITATDENINLKNKLITQTHHKWHLLFRSKGARMGRGSNLDDDISTFYEKFCYKSSDEIHRLFLSEESTYMKIITMFKNHVIDRIRAENAKKRLKTISIQENTEAYDKAKEDSYDFIADEIRDGYRKSVAKQFSKKEYLIVFDLIVKGFTNVEICKKTGFANGKIGSIRHRIKQHLLDIRQTKTG